ncbi:RPM1 interacting protein 13-like isoform X1 [Typha angustifolia]|uniref:RPM1 interacting protein 13-like isoform X1 n=1 Tax=Typha angustifolia TaxID=59011 RepID=UPI003C2C735F
MPSETEVIAVSSSSSSDSDTDEDEEKNEDGNKNKIKTKSNKAKARIKTYKRKRRYPDVRLKSGEEKRREDDECCIIASDAFVVDLTSKISEYDDLTVLAERGQVACRDYPHSRHLCVEYPFSNTSHESYCLQCYCYVCDEAAPCKLWEGHCHASDREKKWKDMRRSQRPVQARKLMPCFFSVG